MFKIMIVSLVRWKLLFCEKGRGFKRKPYFYFFLKEKSILFFILS